MVTADLRLGRWQDALADVEMVDAVITDPPYSERTANGQRSSGRKTASGYQASVEAIGYGFIEQPEVWRLVSHWTPRTRRWFVMFGDHITVRWALDALAEHDWYTFAPVAWAKTDAAPRFMSDGPSSTVEQIAVGRPRRRLDRVEKRYRPGHYHGGSRNADRVVTGGKPSWLMRAIIRDYSEPGDLIVDPYAGGASTAMAARLEGRSCITSEANPDTYAKAKARLDRGYTPTLPFMEAAQ